jgi:hypothetical protein
MVMSGRPTRQILIKTREARAEGPGGDILRQIEFLYQAAEISDRKPFLSLTLVIIAPPVV